MIYVIITASIHNRFGLVDDARRKERYITSISDTLQHIPLCMTPIIVENNGERETYLDHFQHSGQPVLTVYTNNNQQMYQNKAIIEMMDIKEVIRRCGIQEKDMIIKITGRYRMISSNFFMEVYQNEEKYDAFIKCYNVHEKTFDDDDCVLGCFAMRAMYIQLYPHRLMDNGFSAEKTFAKYVKISVRSKKIEQLYMECEFANSNERLIV